MELTTQKEVDDTVTQVQSELVKPYVSDSYQELEYEYTDPTSDLVTPTLPDWEPIGVTFRVATPIFTPVAGSYASAQTVTILCTTSGATIYYTTNGKEPTENSTKYTAPLTVSASVTIKAKAFKDDWTDSYTATGAYTISEWTAYFDNTFWKPWVSDPQGTWDGSKWVSTFNAGAYWVNLEPIGTWASGFRPSKIKTTISISEIDELNLSDTVFNTIAQGLPYITTTELTITFISDDIGFLGFVSFASAFNITNIEFI